MFGSSIEYQDTDISEDDHSELYEDATSTDATLMEDFDDEEEESQDDDESEVEYDLDDDELEEADDVYEDDYDIRSSVEDEDGRFSSFLHELHDQCLGPGAWSIVQSKFIDNQRREQDSPPCDIVTQVLATVLFDAPLANIRIVGCFAPLYRCRGI